MEDLLILANLINKQTAKNVEVINSKFNKSQKQYLFYDKLLNGEITNDIEGSKILFGKTPNHPAYLKLKYRLKKRLLNTLFFIDLNKAKHSEYNQAKLESFKSWATINLLFNRGARSPAIKICHTLLQHSIRYDFTDIQIMISRILMKYYAFVEVDKRKYIKYQDLMFEKLEVFSAELKAESFYNHISHLQYENIKPSALQSLLNTYTKKLNDLKKQYDSYTINYNFYQLKSYNYIQREEYQNAKLVCAEAIGYLKNSNTDSKIAEVAFRRDLHFCHIQLGELEEAKKMILLNIRLFKVGGYNWFREWNHYFIWALASNDHKEMLNTVLTVINQPKIKKLKLIEEIWKVKEAYIQLLIKSNIINRKLYKSKFKQFRITKFLNEVPNYSKDKKGLNISILIIHLLFLVFDKKYDNILKRIDSLKQYSHRYLRNDHTFRSNCFIKMLCKIPDANYHPIALKRHTRKLYDKLSTTSYTYSDNPADIEVIPYENLWEIVLEILRKNLKKS